MTAISRKITAMVTAATTKVVKPKEEHLEFALQLLDFFGQRYLGFMREQLKNESLRFFNMAHNAFYEIQESLTKPEKTTELPKTECFIREFSNKWNEGDLRRRIQMASNALCPFHQTILEHPNPDLQELARIEGDKQKAYDLFKHALSLQSETDLKVTEQNSARCMRLLYRQGAIIHDGECIFFDDLWRMWRMLRPENKTRDRQITKLLAIPQDPIVTMLTSPQRQDARTSRIPEFFPENSRATFQEFVIHCSIISIANNLLNFSVLPLAREELAKRFVQESIRSDICFFTAERQRFLHTFVGQRPSAPLLQLLRYYDTLSQFVNRSDRALLFNVVLFSQDEITILDRQAFTTGWDRLKQVVRALTKKEISDQTEPLFSDTRCWGLLTILSGPNGYLFTQLLIELTKLPKFLMSVNEAYEFCKANLGVPFEEQDIATFLQIYKEVIEITDTQVTCSKDLFFTPPFPIVENVGVKEKSAAFHREMQPYHLSNSKKYCQLLRQFILDDLTTKCLLIADCVVIGANVDEEFVFDAFMKPLEQTAPSEQARRSAREMTSEIHAEHQVPNGQIFALYCDVLQIVMEEGETRAIEKQDLIKKITDFFPSLSKNSIPTLYHYHGRFSAEDCLSPVDIRSVLEKEQGSAIEALKQELSLFFSPPWKQLAHYFHVQFSDKGFEWIDNGYKGRFVPIAANSPLVLFGDWHTVGNVAVFFFSFWNQKKGTCYSATISMGIPLDKTLTHQQTFWELHKLLAKKMLCEGVGREIVGQIVESFPEVPSPRPFLEDVKLAFQSCFSASVSTRHKPDTNEEPIELIASHGTIFDAHPRGSLIPKNRLTTENAPSFIPDLKIDEIEKLRTALYRSKESPQSCASSRTTVTLTASDSETEIPADFLGTIGLLKSIDEEIPIIIKCEDRDEGFWLSMSVSKTELSLYYAAVTVANPNLFRGQFDVHNLLLKARHYNDSHS